MDKTRRILTQEDVTWIKAFPVVFTEQTNQIVESLRKIGDREDAMNNCVFVTSSDEFEMLVKNCRPLLEKLCLNISTETFISNDFFKDLKRAREFVDELFENRNHEILDIIASQCTLCVFSLKNIFKSFTFISAEIEESRLEALRNYELIAENVLKDEAARKKTENLKKVIDKQGKSWIEKCTNENAEFTNTLNPPPTQAPFTAIIGPSLMGKSQFAVTLSKLIPVIYLNFKAYKSGSQPIYRCFESVSAAISLCISNDLKNEALKANENSVSCFELPEIQCIELESVSFLYSLMELGLNYDFKSDGSWIDFYTKVSFVYRKMSIENFVENFKSLIKEKVDSNKRNGILTEINVPVVFIDEYGDQKEILFLRDLCRVLRISCILASTNAKVSNMLKNTSGPSSVRVSWCEILPPVTFKGITNLIKINHHTSNEKAPLSEYISSDGSVNIEGICVWMKGNGDALTAEQKEIVKIIVKLVKIQSPTCLQGVASIVLDNLFNKVLVDVFTGVEIEIFNELIKLVCSAMFDRKQPKEIDQYLFFSLNTFSLFPILVNAQGKDYLEGFASKSIDKHYYFFGATPIIRSKIIPIKRVAETLFVGDSRLKLKLWSHFSQFGEDVFSHLALWASIKDENCENFTVAKIVAAHYNSNPSSFWNVHDLSNSSNPQECLANLAIAAASHLGLSSPIDAYNGLIEFVYQLQSWDSQPLSTECVTGASDKLINFLKAFHLPYLIPQDSSIPAELVSLLDYGITMRCPTSTGFDVQFDLRKAKKDKDEGKGKEKHPIGYIECKNREETLSRASILKYVFKSIRSKIPITIQVAHRVGPSLKTHQSFNSFQEKIEKAPTDAVIQTITKEQCIESDLEALNVDDDQSAIETVIESLNDPKRAKVEIDFTQVLSKAREDNLIPADIQFSMNIYSLTFDKNDKTHMKFKTLYESESAPGGVFIIVESNCALSPKSFGNLADEYKEVVDTFQII